MSGPESTRPGGHERDTNVSRGNARIPAAVPSTPGHSVQPVTTVLRRENRRGGRPPRPPGEKQSRQLTAWCTPAEHEQALAKAAEEGLTLSQFVRLRIGFGARPPDTEKPRS